ncbi:phosphoglycerate dehydrogenase-like oxidoreductase [Halovivax ruber XH-70]|uniref:Phosphoglycerate dehydrogenase-like oxidoreductase n=1 Tax=Halovivax ruber (strain DSM 18193 / JCM 13892 / XH-70) TaxID=797302 RepID=L0IAN6_HALRX|nr:D-2-hydroxyacid dehydrogenase [Halovivax ruber]AGB15878.1 phosphoglycerate dehydrogenase-like oxidoreductase [Halovivax ruber XH-70]
MSSHEILIPHRYDRADRERLAVRFDELDDADVTVATTPDETLSGIETATAVLSPSVSEEWLDRASNLAWVQGSTAGYDHYDLDALEAAGITLTTASGVHGQPIGEWALGAMLGIERDLFAARDRQREGLWLRESGGELASKTVGIVGLGAIGGRIAELAAAVGCRVVGTKRDPSTAPDAVDEVYPADELDEVLRQTDYLVVACPLTDETRGLIDRSAMRTMPRDAVVVNIARGDVVDEEALVESLQQGRLAGAALDVFSTEPLPDDSPLWDLPNVLVTPHVSGSTPHYYDRVAEIFIENYDHFVAGTPEEMRNRVV